MYANIYYICHIRYTFLSNHNVHKSFFCETERTFMIKVYLTIYLSICNRPPKPPVISPIIRPIPLWIIFESKIDNKKYLGNSNIFLYLFGSKLTHSTSILLTKNT